MHSRRTILRSIDHSIDSRSSCIHAMGKTKRDTATSVEESFHKHYRTTWGEERWNTSLYPALAEPTRQAALVNRYAPTQAFYSRVAETIGLEQLEQLPLPISEPREGDPILCYARKLNESDKADASMPMPTLAGSLGNKNQRLMTHWNLDAASILVAYLLGVSVDQNVLDLCAAPGGKSIVLAQKIWPQSYEVSSDGSSVLSGLHLGHLRSNEANASRYRRLGDNLKEYLPAQLFENKNVATLSVDGTDSLAAQKLSIGPQGYDHVLVDAPCSSERHIIHAHNTAKASGHVAPEMANWRPSSSKRLAKTQVELLMTGLKAVKIGGSVGYATCSLEPTENDGVVEKLLRMSKKEVETGAKWSIAVGLNNPKVESELDKNWAERTKYGWIVLPDHPSGGKWGPLYFAMLTKVKIEV